jgi:hypothetical protein
MFSLFTKSLIFYRRFIKYKIIFFILFHHNIKLFKGHKFYIAIRIKVKNKGNLIEKELKPKKYPEAALIQENNTHFESPKQGHCYKVTILDHRF